MKSLIKNLTEAFGPSGYESNIRELVRAEIEPYVESVRVDALGNLIAVKGGANADARKVMLAAHMDEIGLIATHIDENGFVRFTTLGGVQSQNLPGGRVQFADRRSGIIGTEKNEKPAESLPYSKMYIDVGAPGKKDCPVKVGDVAVFERPFLDLGRRVVAKAMDDRIGVVVLIETVRRLKATPYQLYFVFTTQEEVGLRGAATAAFGVDPDIGIAVDVTGTGDTPNGSKMEVSLGKGPAVKFRDGGMISDPAVVGWMIQTAEKTKIPYQREVLLGGTTDARAIQVTRSGVPSGCISIPCRYIHAPSEMVDLEDVEGAVSLLVEMLSSRYDL